MPLYIPHSLRHSEITDLNSFVMPLHLVQNKILDINLGLKLPNNIAILQGYKDADILHH